eukprot:COSAG01_NODE_38_length_33931_cov_75.163632_18_plen_133_part_00
MDITIYTDIDGYWHVFALDRFWKLDDRSEYAAYQSVRVYMGATQLTSHHTCSHCFHSTNSWHTLHNTLLFFKRGRSPQSSMENCCPLEAAPEAPATVAGRWRNVAASGSGRSAATPYASGSFAMVPDNELMS